MLAVPGHRCVSSLAAAVLVVVAGCAGATRVTPVSEASGESHRREIAAIQRDFEAARARQAEAELCRRLVAYSTDAPIERCSVALIGDGNVLLVQIVSACGGDSCDVKSWVRSPVRRSFIEIPGGAGGTIAAGPGGDFLVVDQGADAGDPFGGGSEIILVRVALPSLTRSPFAPCFSARLSPGGKWFVCRDREANVLRIPTGGGRPEIVARSGTTAPEVDWVPYAYVYPDAVEFVASDRLRFEIAFKDAAPVTRTIAWTE